MRLIILDNVYPPAEDSWQTAEVLGWVLENYVGGSGTLRIIDVGSGTGILTLTAIEKAVSKGINAWVISIDYDVNASINTRLNLINNRLYSYADVLSTRTLDAIKNNARLKVIVSNPPYLPGDWLEDWRVFGGSQGNEVIKQIVNYACGNRVDIVVLTQSSLSNWEETVELMGMCNYKLVVVKTSHYFFEDIITMVFITS
ncbi:methyltransferase [Vulcanisaeta sp. EB80]|uniref:methyltransferase n=1 Tax=Vulcanisaeta sp. EB80 TaxID=1650660 RepID=UPI0009BE8484|nr:methyltransferase [Vulcanisaeta sp. EB80]PLC68832.1 methyltransferase [Vulcanisaeta sp. EB80]